MKLQKLLIVLVLILSNSLGTIAQDLYDITNILEIEIVFAQSNWDELLDIEMAGDNNYTEAESVTIDGTTFYSVGVKYKGNSTYDPNQTKNPFHIELDTYVEQDYQGYTDLKLANVLFDPSFVRETVSYNILGQYMKAPQSNYANITVNGTLLGLYTNVESISKKFVNKHFNSKTNAFFSCSPPDGAGPGSSSFPNLEYLGTNQTAYEEAYEMKSDEGWDDLIELCDILNNDINNIETVLDVDRAIWMLAYDNVLVNLDSYIGLFKQNYYLYKDDNGRFNPIVWDLNMSFGVFGMSGEGPPLNSTTQKSQVSHLLHANSSEWPLMQKLMSIPRYKKMYLAHYHTILLENISNSNYLTLANDYQAIVDAAVQADPYKFYTYSQFISNINNDVNVGMNTAPGLTNLMVARNSYLSALADFNTTKPSISDVTPSVTDPGVGDTISITAEVVDTNTDAVFLGYRVDEHTPFTKILMYDDGAHEDGAANDNIYGTSVVVSSSYLQYYIYAENDDIGAFSPARAEHEFYSIDAVYPTLIAGELVVNELMADNETTVTDQDGEYDDWVELYNTTSNTLSLDNLYISDDPADLLIWQFPTGTTIAPNSYLIVWCDKDLAQDGLHANIKLSAGGESVILSYPDGTMLEDVTFGEQTVDMGYARIPNGTGDFVIQGPTFNANNETLGTDDLVDMLASFRIYPNPTTNLFTIANDATQIETIQIFNLHGQKIAQESYQNNTQVTYDLSSFSNGMYFITINDLYNFKLIKN